MVSVMEISCVGDSTSDWDMDNVTVSVICTGDSETERDCVKVSLLVFVSLKDMLVVSVMRRESDIVSESPDMVCVAVPLWVSDLV